MLEAWKAMPHWEKLKARLLNSKSNPPVLVGNSITIADLVLYNLARVCCMKDKAGFFVPEIEAHRKMVASIPQLKKKWNDPNDATSMDFPPKGLSLDDEKKAEPEEEKKTETD